MAYTETESKGWFQRIGDSFAGVLTGIILICAATWLLWWNEERTFKTAGAIGEAQLVAEDVSDISRIDPDLNGRVIHASGLADTKDVIRDSIFGVETTAINLKRKAEYYQYEEESHKETRKKLGGGEETVTTYTYNANWVDSPIDSNNFKDSSFRGRNIILANVEDQTVRAKNVTFGAYKLPDFLADSIGGAVPVVLKDVDRKSLAAVINAPQGYKASDMIHVQGSTVYIGENPGTPTIGDVRITFTETPPANVSIIAQVTGNTFEPFTASNGYKFSRLEDGTHSSAAMFEDARRENNIMAWVLRAVGAVLVMFGLRLVFRPLSVIADVIPILGTIVGAGAGVVAFLIGLAWSLVVIAVAWVRFRPLIAGGLIAAALVLVCLSYMKGRRAAEA